MVGVQRREDVYLALRCHLVSRADQLQMFDEAFRIFWQQAVGPPANPELAHQTLGASVARLALKQRLEEAARRVPWYHAALAGAGGRQGGSDAGLVGSASEHVVARGGYSPLETLRSPDYGDLTPPERQALRRFIEGLAEGPRRPGRRWVPARSGLRWDLARSARRALGTGGELVALLYRKRRPLPRRVVLLLDVSGSMEAYARPLLAAAHGLVRRWGQVEVFAFGTRLTRLTRSLARQQPERALSEAARRVVDWAGGTRIGYSLHQFNRLWARRVLRRGAAVVVVSDGWDRGDLDLLQREMARLQRFCRRLVWISPLPVRPGSDRVASGMKAALPYVDELVCATRLWDLEQLARWLVAGTGVLGVGGPRPTRAQPARAQRARTLPP